MWFVRVFKKENREATLLSGLSKGIIRLSVQINRLSVQINRLSNQINRLSNQIIRLSIQINRLSVEINRLSDQINRLSVQINRLSNQINRLSNAINRLSIQINRLSIQINRLSNAINRVLGWRIGWVIKEPRDCQVARAQGIGTESPQGRYSAPRTWRGKPDPDNFLSGMRPKEKKEQGKRNNIPVFLQ